MDVVVIVLVGIELCLSILLWIFKDGNMMLGFDRIIKVFVVFIYLGYYNELGT